MPYKEVEIIQICCIQMLEMFLARGESGESTNKILDYLIKFLMNYIFFSISYNLVSSEISFFSFNLFFYENKKKF